MQISLVETRVCIHFHACFSEFVCRLTSVFMRFYYVPCLHNNVDVMLVVFSRRKLHTHRRFWRRKKNACDTSAHREQLFYLSPCGTHAEKPMSLYMVWTRPQIANVFHVLFKVLSPFCVIHLLHFVQYIPEYLKNKKKQRNFSFSCIS